MLAKLKRRGPLSINALAAEMVMDRTTLGRNILPLQRDGLVKIEPDAADRRAKALRLTNDTAQVLTGKLQYLAHLIRTLDRRRRGTTDSHGPDGEADWKAGRSDLAPS